MGRIPDASVCFELSGSCGIRFFLRSERESPVKPVGAFCQEVVEEGEKGRPFEEDGAPYGQLSLVKMKSNNGWSQGPSEVLHRLLLSDIKCLGEEQDGRPSDTVNQNSLVGRDFRGVDPLSGPVSDVDEGAFPHHQEYLCHEHFLHRYVEVVLGKLDWCRLSIRKWRTHRAYACCTQLMVEFLSTTPVRSVRCGDVGY